MFINLHPKDINGVINMMKVYNMTKDEWDFTVSMGTFNPAADIRTYIQTSVKSTFTRRCSKQTTTKAAVHGEVGVGIGDEEVDYMDDD